MKQRGQVLLIVFIVLLVMFCFGLLPSCGFHHYGYWPSSFLGTVLAVVLIVWLLKRL